MKRTIRLVFVAAILAIPTGYSNVRAAQSLPGLSVSGMQIVANGIPVRLRGINMGDPFWARNSSWYPTLTLNDYAVLAQQWHANGVRISIFPTEWAHMDHTQLIAGLAQQVNAALSNGMYVILSYHVIGWPDSYYQAAVPGNPADTYDSSMSLATSFWIEMSRLYGSDTRIMFDLWNEPANPADLTSNPSDPNPLWPVLKSYYETLTQAVRSNAAQNIVIATGNRWASWLVGIKDNPLSDPNVVYAYHKYSVTGQNTASVWNKDTGGLIGVRPVLVSEWGYEDVDAGANREWPGTAANYGIPFTTWLEDNHLSNLAWIYHPDWTPAMLQANGGLSLYGQFAESYLASASPGIANCRMYPADNIWNAPINNLPVASRSSSWVNSIGSTTGLHMDFGSGTWAGGPIGIPYNVVDGAQVNKYAFIFYYPNESDPGPYPLPAHPLREWGSDHHILVVDSGDCHLYEVYDASYSNGQWHGGSGAIWDLNSDALRPAGWTSADAAGLPILPGLVRYDEVAAGHINHAIRFTANATDSYIWPARHLTSGTPGVLTSTPPMGARFRLKAGFNISGYPAQLRVILQAMKTYGIILADNGADWYISGAPDSRWDNTMLHLLDNITGDKFEAVNVSSLIVNPNSGATRQAVKVSGNAGVGGATLRYAIGATPKAAVADASGNYSISIPYNWSGTVTPSKTGYGFWPIKRTYSHVVANQTAQNYRAIALVTASYPSAGAYDGWVRESSETSNLGGSVNGTASTFNLGDEAANRQYRAILSFNTTALPDTAVITSSTLKIKKAGQMGTNPFASLGNILVDVRKGAFGNNNALQIGDFQAAASKNAVLTFTNTPLAGGWYSKALAAANFGYINKLGVTQFRLRFATDDNNNLIADYLKFYSGNYGTSSSRPALVIQYYVP